MEELRDDRLSKIVSWLQAYIRGYLSRKEYKKLQEQRLVTEYTHFLSRKNTRVSTNDFNWYFLRCVGSPSRLSSATCASTSSFAPGLGGSCGRGSSPFSTSPVSRMRLRWVLFNTTYLIKMIKHWPNKYFSVLSTRESGTKIVRPRPPDGYVTPQHLPQPFLDSRPPSATRAALFPIAM